MSIFKTPDGAPVHIDNRTGGVVNVVNTAASPFGALPADQVRRIVFSASEAAHRHMVDDMKADTGPVSRAMRRNC